MLSKTHVVIGTSAALTIIHPQTIESVWPVVAGGLIGSVLCDIDCKFSASKDAFLGRVIAGVISAVCVYLDIVSKGPMIEYWRDTSILKILIGIFVILGTGFLARESEHRVFSHSLLAFFLYGLGFYLSCPTVLIAYIIGFTSHLMLDVVTYRPVYLLYPYKLGVSLKLCKSKSIANVIIMLIGTMWLIGICVYLFMKL